MLASPGRWTHHQSVVIRPENEPSRLSTPLRVLGVCEALSCSPAQLTPLTSSCSPLNADPARTSVNHLGSGQPMSHCHSITHMGGTRHRDIYKLAICRISPMRHNLECPSERKCLFFSYILLGTFDVSCLGSFPYGEASYSVIFEEKDEHHDWLNRYNVTKVRGTQFMRGRPLCHEF